MVRRGRGVDEITMFWSLNTVPTLNSKTAQAPYDVDEILSVLESKLEKSILLYDIQSQ